MACRSLAQGHWLVQASLGVVLAAMLGAAALVQRHLQWEQRVRLASVQQAGALMFRPPEGWTPRKLSDGLIFDEPAAAGQPRRTLEIHHGVAWFFASPLEQLHRNGYLPDAQAGPAAPRPITIAGWPGILLSSTRLVEPEDDRAARVRWREMIASALLPGRHLLTLRLSGPDREEAQDVQLLQRVAESLALTASPAPRTGGQIELGDEAGARLPAGLAWAPTADRYRVGRLAVATDSTPWMGVELVPCLLPADEGPSALAAMLVARDPLFQPGEVRQLDAHTWTCSRAGDGGFPAMGFLQRQPDGQALLAEFRWHESSELQNGHSQAEALWRELAPTLRFTGTSRLPLLLANGTAAAERRPGDAGQLLDGLPRTQRWQWYHNSLTGESWTNAQYRLDAAGLALMQDTTLRPPFASSLEENREWTLTRDWTHYTLSIFSRERIQTFNLAQVQDGHITLGRSTSADDRDRSTRDLPRSYVPGGLLPLLIGRFPFEPMMLCTESLPFPPGRTGGGLLWIQLEPTFDAPRALEGRSETMRCWIVQVAGAAESSRWYFDDQGTLQCISFAGGFNVQRIDAAEPPSPWLIGRPQPKRDQLLP